MALGGAILFLVAAVAIVRSDNDDVATSASDDSWGGTLVEPGLPRPDFTLTDTDGQPFDFAAETQGELTMLFFGYTHCPDVCPVQMATLAAALQTPGTPPATVVFVTTDPARDTPERMRQWLGGFDTSFVGLTGTLEEIATAERATTVIGSEVPPEGATADDDYDIGHSAQIITYTPDDQAHVLYPSGVRREHWVADLPRLLDEWGATTESADAP